MHLKFWGFARGACKEPKFLNKFLRLHWKNLPFKSYGYMVLLLGLWIKVTIQKVNYLAHVDGRFSKSGHMHIL